MAIDVKVRQFQVECQESLDALTTFLVQQYEQMTGGEIAQQLRDLAQEFGGDVSSNPFFATNLTPEEKADFVAGYLESEGQATTATNLRLLRKITTDESFARQCLSE